MAPVEGLELLLNSCAELGFDHRPDVVGRHPLDGADRVDEPAEPATCSLLAWPQHHVEHDHRREEPEGEGQEPGLTQVVGVLDGRGDHQAEEPADQAGDEGPNPTASHAEDPAAQPPDDDREGQPDEQQLAGLDVDLGGVHHESGLPTGRSRIGR